jgi:two-component system sensor histidine kinase CpxA
MKALEPATPRARVRFPLYAQVLLWLFLNLAGLSLVFYLVFRAQFHLGLDSLLMGRAGDRIQAVRDLVAVELREAGRDGWNGVLRRFGGAYHVELYLFRNDGLQLAGEPLVPPPALVAKLTEGPIPQRPGRARPLAFEGRERLPPREPEPGPFPALGRGAPLPRFVARTTDPTRYWVGLRFPLPDREAGRPVPVTLLLVSKSFGGGGLFFDFTPWVAVGFAAVLLSALLWLPLVRGVTRSLSRMTRATEEIAEGRFEARLAEGRSDELGSLAQAINRMAGRLAGFVAGQKRFLGDIAHELCSPIARIQVALGILEQRADPKQAAYVADVREEVQQMSSLVNELLSFSKAGLRQREVVLERLNLAGLVRRVLEREAPESAQIELHLDESLMVEAEPELLGRAVGNLIRNALRYAGSSGPIRLSTAQRGDTVTLTVADSGPGVPAEALAQLFDPFFRLESSRSRETGGVGLGLAIVRTCVEACRGAVLARNRRPSGLEVELSLRAAGAQAEASERTKPAG